MSEAVSISLSSPLELLLLSLLFWRFFLFSLFVGLDCSSLVGLLALDTLSSLLDKALLLEGFEDDDDKDFA